VVKLHGSVNWFRLIGARARGRNWFQVVEETDVKTNINPSSIYVREWPEPIINFTCDREIDDNFVYPVLTAPLAGKGPAATVCPETHLATATKWLKDCGKFLIVGVSGLDDDLLSILGSAMDRKAAVIHLVDFGDKPTRDAVGRFQTKVHAFNIPQLKPFNIGFRMYIEEGGLKIFTEAT
jgi:hypothetical protein